MAGRKPKPSNLKVLHGNPGGRNLPKREPKLKTVSLLVTMRATGLSRTYCGMIRRGVRVPHPRHWEAFRGLVRTLES